MSSEITRYSVFLCLSGIKGEKGFRGRAAGRIPEGPETEKPPRKLIRGGVERVMGVEPTYQAWEACILPMNYTRAT